MQRLINLFSLALWRLLVHIENVHAQSVTTGSYVPVTNVQCPEDFTRRTLGEAFLLDPREQEYITGRRALLPDAWSQWLADPSSIGYSLQDLKLTTGEDVPAIALASSGGGYRSALFSAGALTAFDIRNDTAKHIGTGGLLQVSLFHSGLSGGAWLATSLAIHGLPTTRDLILGNTEHGGNLTGWLLDRDLLLPDDFKAVDFYDDIVAQVRSKAEAGFDTGLPDLWSRALAYHLLPGTSESNFFSGTDSHGAGILFSDLRQNIRFMQKEMPLPLVVVNARPPLFENAPPGTNLPLESTVYEITPFEFGSYDPQLSAFIDVKYLGTALDELKPKSPGSCVTNFDQADFVAGSSSSLFFALLYEGRRKLDRIEAGAAEVLLDALGDLLKDVSTSADDAAVVPNPFRGLGVGRYEDANSTSLELIDGASNLEQLPLRPLLMKPRNVEVIVALDGSSDDQNNFPTLLSLIQTQQHESVVSGVAQPLPPVPSTAEIAVRDQINQRPTFFGCDPAPIPEWPLVVYIPNAPPVDSGPSFTNTDTFKLSYTDRHTELFLDQAFTTATSGFIPGELGPDPEWAQCLQCAVVDRQRFKHGTPIPRSQQCQRCFSRYCYDPSNPPRAEDLRVVGRQLRFTDPDPQKGFFERNKKTLLIASSVVGVVFLFGILTCVFCCVRRRSRSEETRYSPLYEDVPRAKTKPLTKADAPRPAKRISAAAFLTKDHFQKGIPPVP